MGYATFLVPSGTLVLGSILGYLLGRYHRQLLEKIDALQNRPEPELPPEPEKPTVTGGAYQPPKEISNAPNNRQKAGIIETKTPQQLEWEHKNELARLEHSA
jgi:hypothetical protein